MTVLFWDGGVKLRDEESCKPSVACSSLVDVHLAHHKKKIIWIVGCVVSSIFSSTSMDVYCSNTGSHISLKPC